MKRTTLVFAIPVGLAMIAGSAGAVNAKAASAPIRIDAITDKDVLFVVGDSRYLIPRSYVSSMPVIGPAGGDWICMTFPDLQPVPDRKPPCAGRLSPAGRGRHIAGFNFNLSGAGMNTTVKSWKNFRDIFHSRAPEILAGSIAHYTYGPTDQRGDVYAWTSGDGGGAAICISYKQTNPNEGDCQNIFALDDGVLLDLKFPESGILLAPQLQSGLKTLMHGYISSK